MFHSDFDAHGPTCPICLCHFDNNTKLPRIMLFCGHTLCTSCLKELIENKNDIKCPLDNISMPLQNKGIEIFPVNYALKQMIDIKPKKEFCHLHQEEIRLYCLFDKNKICDECLSKGGHQKHKLIPIKKIRAETESKIKQLEGLLTDLNEYYKNIEKVFEGKKTEILKSTKEKFEEIYKTLKQKETNLEKEINDFFEEKINNLHEEDEHEKIKEKVNDTLTKFQEYSKTDHIQGLLESIELITSSLNSKIFDQNIEKLKGGFDTTVDTFYKSLDAQLGAFQQVNFPINHLSKKTESIYLASFKNEIPKPEGEAFDFRKFVSLFDFKITNNNLAISPTNASTMEILDVPNKDQWNKVDNVSISLDKATFSKEITESVEYIWSQIGNITFLKIDFIDSIMNDSDFIYLAPLILSKSDKLTSFEICLESCDISDHGFVFFCEQILSKLDKLTRLHVNLRETKITDKSIETLVKKGIENMRALKAFEGFFGNTIITDQSISVLFSSIKQIESFKLDFQSTFITDFSLQNFAKSTLQFMRPLYNFELYLGDTKVSDKGVSELFKRINTIKTFKLDLQSTYISDKSIINFAQNTLLFMDKLEILELYLWGTQITDKAFMKLCVKMEAVKELKIDISKTKVSDKGLQTFIKNTLPTFKALKEIVLWAEDSKVKDQSLIQKIRNCIKN